jgi:hypothetical protein
MPVNSISQQTIAKIAETMTNSYLQVFEYDLSQNLKRHSFLLGNLVFSIGIVVGQNQLHAILWAISLWFISIPNIVHWFSAIEVLGNQNLTQKSSYSTVRVIIWLIILSIKYRIL